MKTGKSGLSAKLGGQGRAAFDAHKDDETKTGGGSQVPDGIEFGIAQLKEIKIGEFGDGAGPDKRGKPFFHAAGVIVTPKFINHKTLGNIKVEGLRTSITEPLCATPTTTRKDIDAHVGWMLNQMRLLGIDSKDKNFTIDTVEEYIQALKDQKPYFRFRTWKGEMATEGEYAGKEPRVVHEWQGWCDPPQEDADSGVVEASSNAPAPASAKKSAPATSTTKPGVKKSAAASSEDKWATWGRLADTQDDTAIIELSEAANEVGVSEEIRNNTSTWVEVADLCREAEANDNAEAATDEEIDFEALGTAADEEYGTTGEAESCAKLRELAEAQDINPDDYPTWTELATALTSIGEDEVPFDYAATGTTADEEFGNGAEGESCTILREKAIENGLNPDDYPTWTDLATELEGMSAADESVAGVDENVPNVGESWGYVDPKTKKQIDCDVIATFPDKKVCNLKSLNDGKTIYKSVPFSNLISN